MRAAQDIAAQPQLRITYAPRGDALPVTEVAVLANIYSFVLRCANKNAPAKRIGGGSNGSENDEREERRQA
jgi:hypothetical protein